jgi:hypothetical protein
VEGETVTTNSILLRTLAAAAGMLIAATAGMAVHAPTASASASLDDASPDVGVERTSLRMPMQVTGFDPEVAAANGYEIVQTPTGQEASVPVEKATETRSGDFTPAGENTRWGNCGYSFVELENVGGKVNNAYMRTGWGISPSPVVQHVWFMAWSDAAGNNNGSKAWGGPIGGANFWQSQFYRTFIPGLVAAEVDASSYAVRADGVICSSLNPITFENF